MNESPPSPGPGAYDEGYIRCSCFWGTSPGRFVKKLGEFVSSPDGMRVLDAGCGEGKNAIFLSNMGAEVVAVDISPHAINNAHKLWKNHDEVSWIVDDVRRFAVEHLDFDIIIAYGLFHCFKNAREIEDTVQRLKQATKPNGYHVVCCFNDRRQDLSGHPNFKPCLLDHSHILSLYSDWNILASSDEDLWETHPHNNIPHSHSISRLIAQKVPHGRMST